MILKLVCSGLFDLILACGTGGAGGVGGCGGGSDLAARTLLGLSLICGVVGGGGGVGVVDVVVTGLLLCVFSLFISGCASAAWSGGVGFVFSVTLLALSLTGCGGVGVCLEVVAVAVVGTLGFSFLSLLGIAFSSFRGSTRGSRGAED